MCIAGRNRGFAKSTKLMPLELARRWIKGASNAICKKKLVTFANNILECKKNAGWSEIPAFSEDRVWRLPWVWKTCWWCWVSPWNENSRLSQHFHHWDHFPWLTVRTFCKWIFPFPRSLLKGIPLNACWQNSSVFQLAKIVLKKRKDISSHISPITRIKLCMKPKYTELGLYL